MKHLGDITKIKGCNAPVVDCIIGGSPCQDLSVAGKRAGLAGERSGLYMEQIRIIKEMRHKDEQLGRTSESIRPRYMVWENVPGAFSSNKGKDFAAVLEEAIKVVEPEAPDVPVPEKGWPTSGCIMGDNWSVAWRVLDAQFWGVPQRRRRIALVADFGGQSAPEILFIRKGVSRDFDESEQARKATARDAKNRTGADDREGSVKEIGFPPYCLQGGGATSQNSKGDGVNEDVTFTLNAVDRHAVVYGISPYHSNCMLSDNPRSGYYEADTARTLDALQCGYPGCNQGGMAVVQPVYSYNIGDRFSVPAEHIDMSPTLTARMGTGGNNVPAVTYSEDVETFLGNGQSVVGTLMANAGTKLWLGNQEAFSGAYHIIERRMGVRYIVRRLTPLECERLQGFPDCWTDIGEWVDTKGKKHKEADSPRYKALGNSIAIPPWKWVLKRLCACYERDATMASLFDGIGGFPYIWEQLNGKGSCLWASEIEEFPIAVTKLRFGGNENGKTQNAWTTIQAYQ
ncbi:MAG: DNA cytosine methyltransferase [Bacteroidales bacterium]|nr:DNA cytosine methyltransferase [Bacteroidales bacterium]